MKQGWLLGFVFAVAVYFPVAMAQKKIVVTYAQGSYEHGIGAQYRDVVAAAVAAARDNQDMAGAAVLLAPVLHYCDQQQMPERIAVSVANVEEYDHYMTSHHDGMPVEWIDHACPAAYKTAAFINIDDKDYTAGIAMLAKAIAMAPYWPEPLAEQGFALNQAGRSQDALVSYRRALKLVDTYPSARYLKAVVLRGIGYSLVELADLEGARAAYEQALEVEPGNGLALRELEYIRQREAEAGAASNP